MTKTKSAIRRTARRRPATSRFTEAAKDLRRIRAEIAPFVKERKFEKISTSGGWCETAAYIADLCKPDGQQQVEETEY